MSMMQQIRDHFVNPANLGAELTLKEISAAIDCDDDALLGKDLWWMANKSHELKCAKNAEGKNVYHWNDKRERADAGGASCSQKSRSAARQITSQGESREAA